MRETLGKNAAEVLGSPGIVNVFMVPSFRRDGVATAYQSLWSAAAFRTRFFGSIALAVRTTFLLTTFGLGPFPMTLQLSLASPGWIGQTFPNLTKWLSTPNKGENCIGAEWPVTRSRPGDTPKHVGVREMHLGHSLNTPRRSRVPTALVAVNNRTLPNAVSRRGRV